VAIENGVVHCSKSELVSCRAAPEEEARVVDCFSRLFVGVDDIALPPTATHLSTDRGDIDLFFDWDGAQ
jgi:hypothetical protein